MANSKHHCIELLKAVNNSKSKRKFLKNCASKNIKSICECVLNLLKGNIPINKKQKNKLAPFKRSLRKLANKKTPLYRKRAVLVQRGGGFLGFLIPAAITALTALINNGSQ